MRKLVIFVVWLQGLAAIGWTCSSRQDTRQSDGRLPAPAVGGAG